MNYIKSIFSNNCWGGCILHKCGVEFRSPTVNLFTDADSYIKFLKNFRYYVKKDIVFDDNESNYYGYIVGHIEGIKFHFMHYNSQYEVSSSWKRRSERIPDNNDDILFEICDRDGFSEKTLCDFANLPYKNKIGFLKKGRFNTDSHNIFFEVESNEDCSPPGSVLADITYDIFKKNYKIE
ncbi:DUF1919 domain-containing protein [Acetobacter pasteurianus]|uniref:DUF1919 domain-containing protein n=1 Tax=Acetobacter pasteurianus subsp. pasteurianus TaxID=481145 RepID=A0A1Y0Y7H9_ACEPA|nr:DUF1919 domain-containing protein [Acetobacter pasteurianus]ARW48417.1 hypothetical protein S1001342_02104 [Acetobacter pasteurianus subsp. pasteurianus]